MSDRTEWARAYARQADADFKAWELYEKHPETVAAACHKLLFLQMACEKLCKAHLIHGGAPPESLQASHGYIAKPLPSVIKDQLVYLGYARRHMAEVVSHVHRLAHEIEMLNPAIRKNGQRPDNCEYPWEVGGQVVSPLDWTFSPLRLCTEPTGRTFLKLLRGSLDRILK